MDPTELRSQKDLSDTATLLRRATDGIDIEFFDNAQPRTTSRYYDTSPYKGGASIHLDNASSWTDCSSAFYWITSTGAVRGITASHCVYSKTGSVRNNVYRWTSSTNVSKIGNIAWSSGNNNGTKSRSSFVGDIAAFSLTTGTASGRVYHGAYNTNVSRPIAGRSSLPQGWKGTTLQSSGAAGFNNNGSGVVKPDWISLVNHAVTYKDGQKYTGLTVAEHASQCTKKGDSGGAYYVTNSSNTTVRVVGVISGSNGQGGGWTNCRNYYTPTVAILTGLGGSGVVTG